MKYLFGTFPYWKTKVDNPRENVQLVLLSSWLLFYCYCFFVVVIVVIAVLLLDNQKRRASVVQWWVQLLPSSWSGFDSRLMQGFCYPVPIIQPLLSIVINWFNNGDNLFYMFVCCVLLRSEWLGWCWGSSYYLINVIFKIKKEDVSFQIWFTEKYGDIISHPGVYKSVYESQGNGLKCRQSRDHNRTRNISAQKKTFLVRAWEEKQENSGGNYLEMQNLL